MNEIYCPIQNYTVFVRTITYNQSKYITDALNGVAMQQTDFPFVHFIMDDASTDGEQDVILEWMNGHCDMTNAEYIDTPAAKIILTDHLTNNNCTYAVYLLKQNLYNDREERIKIYHPWREHAKYEAPCEGDDYWTNPLKLQTQVSYLETHPEISLSCCRYDVLDTHTGISALAPNNYFDNGHACASYFEFTRHEAFGECGWITKTLTCLYRINEMHPEFPTLFKYGRDVHVIYDILSSGNGVCHSINCGVYRKCDSGIFGGKTNIEKSLINYRVFKELCSKVNDPQLFEIALNNFKYLIANKEWILPHNFQELRSYFILFKQIVKRRIQVNP